MKWLFLYSFCLISTCIFPQGTDLTINICNINPSEGIIELALFNNAEDFPREGKEFRVLKLEVSGKTLSCTINDLPPGQYAVALYHDLNKDGICNKNILGVPTEGYAFSNNVRPRIKAPSFKKAAFDIHQKDFLKISMIY